jgi:hypothetical protein
MLIVALLAAAALAVPGHALAAAPPLRQPCTPEHPCTRTTPRPTVTTPSHQHRTPAPFQPVGHPNNPINRLFRKWKKDRERLNELLGVLGPDRIQQMPLPGTDPA